jgi:hypothetical protein
MASVGDVADGLCISLERAIARVNSSPATATAMLPRSMTKFCVL